jgi:hypothetical protein
MQHCQVAPKILIGEFVSRAKKDHQELIYVTTTTSIESTAKVLADNNILAVPIYNEQINEFVGIVDVMQICRFATIGKYFDTDKHAISESDFDKFVFPNKPVGELILNNENCILYVYNGSATLQASTTNTTQ